MEIKDRFLEILSKNRISQQEMAERIGVDASTISCFCKGKRKPGFEILERIAVAFPNVDLNWLIAGNGSELNISTNGQDGGQISNSHESLNGQLKFEQYIKVEKYLNESIKKFWASYPKLNNKKFMKSMDKDINKAIELCLIDDNSFVENDAYCDYVVCCESKENVSTQDESRKHIYLKKNNNLKEEELWWDMAEQLLFKL